MKLSQVVKLIRERLPVELVADHDNVGLVAGDYDDECRTMLVVYELNDSVAGEAIGTGSNLIVTYHTPLFRPTKSFTTSSSRPDPLFRAVRSGVNIFSVHTALDVVSDGLNFDLGARLGLRDVKRLAPLENTLQKIVVFVPADHLEKVRAAMSRSGAGVIGNYTDCSFSSEGEGAFVPGAGATPYKGTPGKPERAAESRLEMVVNKSMAGAVIDSMLDAHPYDEVAFDVYPLLNLSPNYGFGAIGELEEPMPADRFFERLKSLLGLRFIRVSHVRETKVRKVALCAGSGVPFYKDAVREGADIFITGDVKHHDFREGKTRSTMLADATHHGTEKFAAEVLHGVMKKLFEDRIVVNLSKHDYDSAVIV